MAKKTGATVSGDDTIDMLNKLLGSDTVIRLGSAAKQSIDVIPTGIMPVDLALGIGGVPRGRMIEIYGPESGGKTTLALHIVAEAQKLGLKCLYVDAEYALDPIYAKAIGVDVDELLFAQPDTAEDALEIIRKAGDNGGLGLIVVDSVAALSPRAELEGEIGDANVGLMPRLMSQSLRMSVSGVGRSNMTVIFINQVREKVGVMYGNPETTPGGRALRFYSSVRMSVRRTSTNKSGDEAVSNRVKVKVEKNKVGPPYRIAEFDIEFGHGADILGSLIDMAVGVGALRKNGAWYNFEGENIGLGKEKTKAYLRENAATTAVLREAVAGKHTDVVGEVIGGETDNGGGE